MARKKRCYDTKEMMQTMEEGRHEKSGDKKKPTGQSKHSRSNGKVVGGGKRSSGVAK